jgi:hypothetical protein
MGARMLKSYSKAEGLSSFASNGKRPANELAANL